MFDTLVVQPIFNLLALIYALLPGHNLGLAIIIFTVIVRLLMWPLVKKQLHQVKVMRKIQPELKRIKAEAKGDKRKETALMMELYKERGINPFGSIGVLLLQIPILLGLYWGLQRLLKDPGTLETLTYPFVHSLSWIQQISNNAGLFDATLFGVVDLTKSAMGQGGVYWPAMLLVIGSAVVQYFQSVQLMPSTKDARKLRDILKDAGKGKQADQSEVNAAIGRSTKFLLPALIFFFTINLPSALSLYWLVSGLTALIQQTLILREDATEMEDGVSAAKEREKNAIEAEVVQTKKRSATAKKTRGKKGRKK